jgi:hypothetical protein
MSTLTPAIPLKDPAPEGTGRSRGRRALLAAVNLVLFATAVFGARTLLVRWWPWEPDGDPADKLAAFAEAPDRYNTIVVGSSRVLREVDPATFDTRMATLGYATRTFNLGIPGMTSPEMRDYLRRIMQVAPAGLEFVIIAPEFLDGSLEDDNVASIRVIAWHDSANTVTALRAAAASGRPLAQRAEWSYNHVASYLANLSGTSQLWAALSASPAPRAMGSIGPDGNGWYSLDDQLEMGNAAAQRGLMRRRNVLLQLGEEGFASMVHRLVRRAEAADASLPALGSEEASYLADLVEIIRAGGAAPIFMVPPGGSEYNSGWLRRAEADGIIPVVLDFGDPRPWPDLFTFDSWFDPGHLGEEASIRFSAYLADEVAGYLRAALTP